MVTLETQTRAAKFLCETFEQRLPDYVVLPPVLCNTANAELRLLVKAVDGVVEPFLLGHSIQQI